MTTSEKSVTTNKHKQFINGMLCLVATWFVFSLLVSGPSLPSLSPDDSNDIETLPNFASYSDVKEKKKAFFDFLYPITVTENIFLINIREQLSLLSEKHKQGSLTSAEQEWLDELKDDYLIETEDTAATINILLRQVNIIPPSLILAQAAIESGWGTSRFATKANNLFGHWCFSKGCGLVPKRRDDNKGHEVASFETVNESIRSYLKNLNSFHRYEQFRKLRSQSEINTTGTGVLALLPGLKAYSEQGDLYIRKVTNMIKQNKLQRFDRLFIEQLNKK